MRSLLLAALTALALAACAGNGGYADHLDQASTSLARSLDHVGRDVQTEPVDGRLAASLEADGRALDGAADRFARIPAPITARRAHAKLIGGAHGLAATVREASRAARAGDADELASILGGVRQSPGAREYLSGVRALRTAGFSVEGAALGVAP